VLRRVKIIPRTPQFGPNTILPFGIREPRFSPFLSALSNPRLVNFFWPLSVLNTGLHLCTRANRFISRAQARTCITRAVTPNIPNARRNSFRNIPRLRDEFQIQQRRISIIIVALRRSFSPSSNKIETKNGKHSSTNENDSTTTIISVRSNEKYFSLQTVWWAISISFLIENINRKYGGNVSKCNRIKRSTLLFVRVPLCAGVYTFTRTLIKVYLSPFRNVFRTSTRCRCSHTLHVASGILKTISNRLYFKRNGRCESSFRRLSEVILKNIRVNSKNRIIKFLPRTRQTIDSEIAIRYFSNRVFLPYFVCTIFVNDCIYTL